MVNAYLRIIIKANIMASNIISPSMVIEISFFTLMSLGCICGI